MARIDSGFPSLLVFFHDIAEGSVAEGSVAEGSVAEGSDARSKIIEERFQAFLLVLRVSVHSSSHNR
jgi:hypothetical protein